MELCPKFGGPFKHTEFLLLLLQLVDPEMYRVLMVAHKIVVSYLFTVNRLCDRQEGS